MGLLPSFEKRFLDHRRWRWGLFWDDTVFAQDVVPVDFSIGIAGEMTPLPFSVSIGIVHWDTDRHVHIEGKTGAMRSEDRSIK